MTSDSCVVAIGGRTLFHSQVLEELKIRDVGILDLQKRIAEEEAKLKQQQNMYEAIRADRNMYSKNLISAQDGIQELKRKLKILTHQIDQLKEEIGAKDLALLKEHFDHMKVQKEKDTLRSEVHKLKGSIEEVETAYANQKSEVEKLTGIIHEADQVDALLHSQTAMLTLYVYRNARVSGKNTRPFQTSAIFWARSS